MKTLGQLCRKNTFLLLAIFFAFSFLEFVDDVHGSFVKKVQTVRIPVKVDVCPVEGVVGNEVTFDEGVAA